MTVSILRQWIIVFYIGKKKHVIGVGSSMPDMHNVLLCKHAEEYAIQDIKKYLSKYGLRKMKDLKIIIWKQNKEGIIRTTDCCAWCKKRLLKTNIGENQVITPLVDTCGSWNGAFKSSIIENAKIPVLKTTI